MIIKKLRLKSTSTNLKNYKEYREIDKSKYDYKRDFYYDKEAGSNYEARIYGDLFPNENGALEKEVINS